MKIAITGATGLLGRPLMVKLLEAGHTVNAICRKRQSITELAYQNIFEWDAMSEVFPRESLIGVDTVVHLAGDPVADSRWTREKKKRILDSRVQGTRKLIETIASMPVNDRPKHLISGSAIGIYGDQGDRTLNEKSSAGSGFLADVVKAWEAESLKAKDLGLRVVHLRTGVVLSRQGGALPKMPPFAIGSGLQWVSFIHEEDWQRFVMKTIHDLTLHGDYNLTAPQPCTNLEFTDALKKVLHFKVKAPKVPAFVLKAILGEMSEVVLASHKVLPMRVLESGFEFKFKTISTALEDLFRNQTYLEEKLQTWQFVPEKVETVFPFFSAAENLEKITPDWLNFKIEKQSTPNLEENTIIDYKLKIHGIPAKWKTRILDWTPGEQFVDDQVKGPYSRWHHTHTFKKVEGGTLLGDEVLFQVPGNLLGKVFLGNFIKNDVSKIFRYRQKIIQTIFGKN